MSKVFRCFLALFGAFFVDFLCLTCGPGFVPRKWAPSLWKKHTVVAKTCSENGHKIGTTISAFFPFADPFREGQTHRGRQAQNNRDYPSSCGRQLGATSGVNRKIGVAKPGVLCPTSNHSCVLSGIGVLKRKWCPVFGRKFTTTNLTIFGRCPRTAVGPHVQNTNVIDANPLLIFLFFGFTVSLHPFLF